MISNSLFPQGVNLGLTAEAIGSCPTAKFQQTFNQNGHAEFKIWVEHDTEPVNTISMTVVFGNVPIEAPTIVSKTGHFKKAT